MASWMGHILGDRVGYLIQIIERTIQEKSTRRRKE